MSMFMPMSRAIGSTANQAFSRLQLAVCNLQTYYSINLNLGCYVKKTKCVHFTRALTFFVPTLICTFNGYIIYTVQQYEYLETGYTTDCLTKITYKG